MWSGKGWNGALTCCEGAWRLDGGRVVVVGVGRGGGLGRAPPNPLNQGVRTSRQRSNEGARRSDELVGGWY